ncbi:uncharacterized protein LOC125652337 [Ostrea edulis]|uniref:uncharacterized protein LOC125652337 n=1 Tax=Ostrea edulis TaxID=37623 RepID=UPI0024AE9AB4|nr:uncharacterized protein LOC125652337 [Ostrea edulis]
MILPLWLIALVSYGQSDASNPLIFGGAQGDCKPICPCLMDGINYDHGEQWKKKGYPCTTYECFNGFYKAIKEGCDYKGTCKSSGITWTENCFTYKCDTSDDISHYSLVEGGCLDSYGNCRAVGERFSQNCNTVECQVVNGSCFHLVTITKGCIFEGDCRTLNSFWHDGCSVYQCMQTPGSVTYQKLTDEVMYWPQGPYGLLMPENGCPDDIPSAWSNGSRLHYSNGRSMPSFSFHLYGNYSKITFQHFFCIHDHPGDPFLLPRYQTYWDAGKYCIFRVSGQCPNGFQDGFIGMDDLNGLEFMQTMNGSVPDGVYDKDTGFFFCCRFDGDIDNPIVLPKDEPFVLFKANGSTDCQSVRGMVHQLEFFLFDDENINTKLYQNGSLPEVKRATNNTVIYFCYYTPISCGCEDENGNMIKLGEKVQKNCVWYRCKRFQNNLRYLEVIKGGCSLNGRCVSENKTWTVTKGEMCSHYMCIRQRSGPFPKYFIKKLHEGCIDGGSCRGLGFSKRRGCYELQCRFHPQVQRPYYKLVRAGCSDGMGGCLAINTTKVINCISYRCERHSSNCGLDFYKGGCNDGGECHDVNTTWTSKSCHVMNCRMTATKSGPVRIKTTIKKYACKFYGKCYKEGQIVKASCVTRQCKVNREKNTVTMEAVHADCKVNGECVPVNTTYRDGCSVKRCYWRKQGNVYTSGSDVVTFGCKWKDSCINESEIRQHDCTHYICRVSQKGRYKRTELAVYSQDCKDKQGKCISVGSQSDGQNCKKVKCVSRNGLSMLENIATGCLDKKECREDGGNWTHPGNCVTYGCRIKSQNGGLYPQVQIVNVGCQMGGVCYSAGETWDSGCLERKCVVKRSTKGFSRSITAKLRGCTVNGKCLEIGFQEMRDKCLNYACMLDKVSKRPVYKLLKGACRDLDGNCRDVGEEWNHLYKPNKVCLRLKCAYSGGVYRISTLKILCKDKNDNCRQQGERGFPGMIGGRTYKNCQCKAYGRQSRLSCSP